MKKAYNKGLLITHFFAMNTDTFFASFSSVKRFVMNRPFTVFLISATALLVFFFVRQALTPPIVENTTLKTATPKEVSIFTIGTDTPTGTVIGTLDRQNVSTIVATTSGIVRDITVKEGSFVTNGMAIAHISPSAGATARALAEAQLAATEKSRATEQQILDLNKKISQSEATTGKKDDLASATKKLGSTNLDLKLLTSQLNVEIAKAGESNTTPFAPFAGKIEALYVSPGDLVTPGTPIASIVGSTPRSILRADIPTALALRIDAKHEHLVTLPSGQTIPVTLLHISSSALSINTFRATFSIPDADAKLLGDTSALEITLALKGTDSTDATLIPLSAIHTGSTASSVLVLRDGTAASVTITPGATHGNFVESMNGLREGDQVILDRDISIGDSVTLKN